MKWCLLHVQAMCGHLVTGIGVTIAMSGSRGTGNVSGLAITTIPIAGCSATESGTTNAAAGIATDPWATVTEMAFLMPEIVIATVMACPIALTANRTIRTADRETRYPPAKVRAALTKMAAAWRGFRQM